MYFQVLDPRISYQGLARNFTEEPDLIAHLNRSVVQMQRHLDPRDPRRGPDAPAPAAPVPRRTSTSDRNGNRNSLSAWDFMTRGEGGACRLRGSVAHRGTDRRRRRSGTRGAAREGQSRACADSADVTQCEATWARVARGRDGKGAPGRQRRACGRGAGIMHVLRAGGTAKAREGGARSVSVGLADVAPTAGVVKVAAVGSRGAGEQVAKLIDLIITCGSGAGGRRNALGADVTPTECGGSARSADGAGWKIESYVIFGDGERDRRQGVNNAGQGMIFWGEIQSAGVNDGFHVMTEMCCFFFLYRPGGRDDRGDEVGGSKCRQEGIALNCEEFRTIAVEFGVGGSKCERTFGGMRPEMIPWQMKQMFSTDAFKKVKELGLHETDLTVNTIFMDARAHAWFDDYRFGIWPVEEKGSWYGKIFRFEQGRCDVDGEWLLAAARPAKFPQPNYGQPETSEQREARERDEKEREEDKTRYDMTNEPVLRELLKVHFETCLHWHVKGMGWDK
ncbi:hypothetical protein FB451DRAFT_1483291 [Mycena latifolia]|nr:hypothetical protein FB451DRAFT_1483291 [Mycena latifolia]